jgi:hypothetical protein
VSALTYWITLNAQGAALDEHLRSRILNDLVDLCFSRDWVLSAAHVRADRVQAVITTTNSPHLVHRAVHLALRRHWHSWITASPRLLRRGEKETAIQATVGRDLMAVFVAGA